MKKIIFVFLFMLIVLFSERECKGPDGDSKPTPFRKENNSHITYIYYADNKRLLFSVFIFLSITVPAIYYINKKF